MALGPVQIMLFSLSSLIGAAILVRLFVRPDLEYVRWPLAAGLVSCLALDALRLWGPGMPGEVRWINLHVAVALFGAAAWLHFARRYARPRGTARDMLPVWFIAAAGAFLALSPLLPEEFLASSARMPKLILTPPGFAVRVLTLAVLIMALTGLEATLVNSVHGQRWKIKFTILGAFSILAAQVFTLSLGLLYHSIDLSLAPARQIGMVIGAAFMLYSLLFRGKESPVHVSKRLARTSVVLFGAGIYLLFLGALGLSMSLTGGANTRALLLALAVMSGVGLMAVLLSDRFRRRFTRLLQHYFYKEKYDYRIQWLSFTKRLANARNREELHDAVLLGFCETFGMSAAVLYLRDSHAGAFAPARSWELYAEPPLIGMYGPLSREAGKGVAAVDLGKDMELEPEHVREFLSKTGAAFAVPLMKGDVLDGFVILAMPHDAGEVYNQEDFDLMEALAGQAYSAMLNLRLADLLSQARAMEVMGKVSTFVVHDLKNLIYALSLIVDNAKRYISEPEFQADMLRSLENTVARMHVLISQLRQLPNRDNLTMEPTDLQKLVQDTFRHSPLNHLNVAGGPVNAMVDRTQMQKVLLNLVLNAREASPENAEVLVETGQGKSPYLRVKDNGAGMDGAFLRDCLFQPFKTTKPGGMGIGLYQCKQIVEAHGGSMEVTSVQGEGSIFTVWLPACDQDIRQEGA